MALVTRDSLANIEPTSAQRCMQLPGNLPLYAGEDLDPAAPCYIKNSDNKVYMSNGTAANEAAKCHGFTATSYKTGEPVTLFRDGAIFHYDNAGGLTPGNKLYIGATKGRLDSAATTGDTVGVATAVTTKIIVVDFR
jgi:hypothetical protein